MLKQLLKKQMTEIFRSCFYDAKKNRTRSKAKVIGSIILFVAVMVGLLGGVFTVLSFAICGVLADAGVDWLYFSIMGLISVLLGTFGSVFNTYSCLYLSKDNDLLLSLPIPVNVLLVSRLLTVYLMGLIYSIVVILPAILVYWITVSISLVAVLGSLLLILLISVFVLTLSCVLGWVVAKISLRLKHKSIVTVMASLGFIVGYYFFYYKAQVLIRDLIANAVSYGAYIKGSAYPLYLFGRVATCDLFAMAVVSAVVFGLFILMWILISRSFLKTATSSGRIADNKYKERTVRQKGVASALLSRELSRFISTPAYMLNCGLGIFLLPICGLLILWKGDATVSVLSEVFGEQSGLVPMLLSSAVFALSSMNGTTAPSVSLEGKTLWLIQSLPISSWQVLSAKLKMQILLTGIPSLFCMICIALIYPYSPIELLLAFLVPLSFVLFYAQLGLFFGLKMPTLNWTNEITPIKQSACVAITMLCGFAYTVFVCVGFILLDGWKLGFTGYMAVVGGITVALSVLLRLWLRGKGCRHFALL